MITFSLLKTYFAWHYSVALLGIWKIFIDIEWFLYNFFSTKLLLQTLFSKWRRLGEKRTKKVDIMDFFTVLIVNTLMRIIGVFVRLFLIITSIVFMVVCGVISIVVFFVWLVLPLLIISSLVVGLKLLFL